MNVFILDRDMRKSAQMLDDAHLKAQINEACQILMANYNKHKYPKAKIGHSGHPVTKFYEYGSYQANELFSYLGCLLDEYHIRFGKLHQNTFWWCGFLMEAKVQISLYSDFVYSKTYVNGNMTDDIESIRKYISTKPHTRPLTWTNRDKPDWWEV